MLNEVTKAIVNKVFYLIPGQVLKNVLRMVYNDITINEHSTILERSESVGVYVEHGVEDHTEDENEEEDSENDLKPIEGHTDDDNEELVFTGKKLKVHMGR